MSYALVDNATLSAVQRLMGEAPSRSRSSVDPDICALENYVQATIFYDKILAIDDYKAALRSSRAAAFPQVNFLSPDEFNLKPFEDEAQEISSAMRPEIRGGAKPGSECTFFGKPGSEGKTGVRKTGIRVDFQSRR